MKIVLITLLMIPGLVFAQKVDIKDVEASGDGDTTIEISKGKKKNQGDKCDAIWEVVEGSADITGDSSLLAKEANENWRKAADKWEKDFRADNKENKVLSVSRGKANCTSDAAGKICSSQASYKMKTKLN